MSTQDDAEPDFWSAKVLLPFILITLIWGSTWLVIKDQIGSGPSSVPASWSVTYRFAVAAIGMFALVAWYGEPWRLGTQGQLVAIGLGVTQFTMNFNFVYRAEAYVTSGLVAVLFAMLMVPNALFARAFLGQRSTGAFWLGTLVALAGIALLFVQEYRAMASGSGAVLIGIGLTFCAILSASASNVMQSAERVRNLPMFTLLAWAMLWGTLFDAVLAWALTGPPVFDPRPAYIAGILYLGIIGSVVAFPFYFTLIRQIGAAKAAYNGVAVPVIAMLLSTLFEDYVWSPLAIGGAVLGLAGLVIAMRSRRVTPSA